MKVKFLYHGSPYELTGDKLVPRQVKDVGKNAKRGFYRIKQMKNYSEEEYHQRSLIEAGLGAVKRKYGGYTLAKHIRAIKVEAYLKATAFNLRLAPQEIFN